MSKRRALAAGLALSLIAGLACADAVVPFAVVPNEMSLGSPRAPVTVVEYASLGCPHCAAWARDVFPAFKKTYVDTGKVRYVLKEMLFGDSTVAAAGFMTARCAGPDKYFTVVDQVFRSQARWTQGNIKPIFQEIAAANGLDEARFNACITDQAAAEGVARRAQNASDQDGVNSTPTIFINGKKLDSVPLTPAEMDAAIAAALKGGR